MKRIRLVLFILFAFTLTSSSQTRKSARKKASSSTTAKKKRQTSTKKNKKTADYETASIKGLKNERAQIKKQIVAQQQKLRKNERDVKERLKNLMVINSEIADKRRTIDTIRRDITHLDGNITKLNSQLDVLGKELNDRKQKYVKSMRYMHRNRSIQSQLMFIFSAKNFSQMYRRMRFMREYASYQRAQGEEVKTKQAEVTEKHQQLTATKKQKSNLLYKGEQERLSLEGKQVEQQKVVNSLQKQQKTIQGIIAQQQKRDAAINAQIDRLVAIEVEKARQRAIAEAKRKAAEEAKRAEAERKRKAEELARKQAELARKQKEAEAAKRKAEEQRNEEDRKAIAEAKKLEREVEVAKKEQAKPLIYNLDSEDRRISGSFESNRGRLPMPITGGYRIVSHFGQYNVEGLNNVRLDNKGINILGSAGAKARSIFDGEVSAVFSMGGVTGVMVRHGSYISVYCNLSSVSVHRGQKVSARQVLGSVGQDNILQFQLRKERAKLNPEAWLGR
ncbi:MAG: peptidoglycan DD-metalloendopeptidase family protein [Prevotella sp.]|mgnify:FL=1|nr:peptidoglycan DD-metalloendopeptidase family protein [Prevotella sp.]MCI7578708.1 peptidoglycan DD-metalloendopeptidase family protein [Prevotella sp.]MDD7030017.1 peptidoglycan DD-metalloendopeptidase family protein [Prevotellaceae bacterium]MDY3251861.1 peptidoglycan DD-metalloendopeptidase family protein [Prevotella sp.]MDY5209013.1 peptidoglycan DD-metalloendopeptidase family protein [Prevotella sp.]